MGSGFTTNARMDTASTEALLAVLSCLPSAIVTRWAKAEVMADARSRPPLIDWDRVRSGAIPWTSDGYMEVLNFKQTLRVTPKDDWDLTHYRFAVEFSEGVVRGFELNPLMYEDQIGLFIKKRYADEGVTIIAAHMLRYFEMNWFLSKHRKRFEREGFIRKSRLTMLVLRANQRIELQTRP